MTIEEIKKRLEELEEERWQLSISTDFFNDWESKKYGELCEEISKLEKMLKEME